MKLVLQLSNEEEIVSYVTRGKEPLFTIYWEHDGTAYPQPGWVDFGITLLGLWFAVMIGLCGGASRGRFVFMEGPVAIGLDYDPSTGYVTLQPLGADMTWTTTLPALAAELVEGAEKLEASLERLGVTKYQQRIARAVQEMREAIQAAMEQPSGGL